jgi:hypothetical protein
VNEGGARGRTGGNGRANVGSNEGAHEGRTRGRTKGARGGRRRAGAEEGEYNMINDNDEIVVPTMTMAKGAYIVS